METVMQAFRQALVFITLVTCATFPPSHAVAFDDSILTGAPEVHVKMHTVQHFAELADGTIALGSSRGLGLWHNGKLQHFVGKYSIRPLGPEDTGPSDLPADSIDSLQTGRDGALWIGTNRGLARYREGNLEDVTPGIRKILNGIQPQRQMYGMDLTIMSLFRPAAECVGRNQEWSDHLPP
jgi:hypothetical protein